MNRIKLITLDPTLPKWKSLEAKRKKVIATFNQAKNADFAIDIEYQDLSPAVKDGRVTHDYMDLLNKAYFDLGFDFVALHFGSKQWKKYNLQQKLRGAHQIDTDEVAELYFWADEKTKREGLNQFEQTFPHEMSHAYCRGAKVIDLTHAWHDANPDISGIWAGYDMNLYQPYRVLLRKSIPILTRIRDWFADYVKAQTTPAPFFDKGYPVTRAFGVKDRKHYPQTGIHIGTDFATPIGIPVFAPLNGQLKASESPEVGKMATLTTDVGTYQFLHLLNILKDGTYLKGEQIAVTGNTGASSTGPHVCVRKWKAGKKPDITVLTSSNVEEYLVDVTL